MTDQIVSWHVRLRWLERIRQVDVESFRRDLAAIDEIKPEQVSERELVEWICAAYEMGPEALDAEIVTDGVRRAVEAGAVSVKIEGGKFRLAIRNGVICTIMPVRQAKHRGGKPRKTVNRLARGREKCGPARHQNG